MSNITQQRKNEIVNNAFTYLIGYIATHGYSPTVRELSKATGYKSSSGGHAVLKLLEERGLIQYDNSPRAIKVIGYSFVKIPHQDQ